MVGPVRHRFLILSIPLFVLLAACATTSPASPSAASDTARVAEEFLTLSPVPLMLRVPSEPGEFAWVGQSHGPDIVSLAPTAAVRLEYRRGAAHDELVANILWFTEERYATVMGSPDAPKGIEIGVQGGHVLFVQPALDMPFDPASQDAAWYGTLVERARDFRWYSMIIPGLTLVRP